MQDYEQLITPGHVAGHRARAIMVSLYKPAVVSYVAGVALAVCAVSGIAGSSIGAPEWLDRALTVDSKPYFAAKEKADQAAAQAKLASAKTDADAAALRLHAVLPGLIAPAQPGGLAVTDMDVKIISRMDDLAGNAATTNLDFMTALTGCRNALAATDKNHGSTGIQTYERCVWGAAGDRISIPPPGAIAAQIQDEERQAKAQAAQKPAPAVMGAPATPVAAPQQPTGGGLQAPENLAPSNQPASPARIQARQALLNATISTPETMASAQHTVAEIEANARIMAQGHQDAAAAIDRCAADFNAHLQAIHSGSDTRENMPGYVAQVENCDRDAGLSVGE